MKAKLEKILPWLMIPVLFAGGVVTGRRMAKEPTTVPEAVSLREFAERFTPECDAIARHSDWEVPFSMEVLAPEHIARVLTFEPRTGIVRVTYMDPTHHSLREEWATKCDLKKKK